MYFQIDQIVLWPRHVDEPPRVLQVKTGEVNVITGASKTGKSAIVPIIDYCLGSDRCAIPVRTIRDSCSWFGVVVETEAGKRLYARREPEEQRSTGDMFVVEGSEVALPHRISARNANVSEVRHGLDELSGLTQLSFDPEVEGGFKGRPSFRDMAAFNFQPQNVIANPDVFFFKADTYEHQEKLRAIFPYVLGAVTPETLATQHELARLRQQLRAKEREVASIRSISERWVAEIQSKIDNARELGLIPVGERVPDDLEARLSLLRAVSAQTEVDGLISAESVGEAAGELADLQNEEGAVAARLGHLRRRLAEMDRLRESAQQHGAAVGVVRDRLQLSRWFRGLHEESSECPVCGNTVPEPVDKIQDLVTALEESEKVTGEAGSIPAAFDREYQRVRADIDKTAEELRAVAIRRSALARDSEQVEREQFRLRSIWRFMGELGEAINRYEALRSDDGLDAEIDELRDRISVLARAVDDASIRRRTGQALSRVGLFSSRLLPKLDAESPDDPVSLSIRELTVRVSASGREDSLWEIGSGANWLSYHVAVMLGLHEHFRSLDQSPVPSFLVLDQPSQVYFPRRAASRDLEEEDPEWRDEDVVAVRRVFAVLSEAVSSANGAFQAIVLDHAASNVWGELPNMNLVEEWRDGRRLVPDSWIV